MFKTPKLPKGILTTIYKIDKTGGHFDYSQGGIWIEDSEPKVPFEGRIMPLNQDDLKYDSGGTYTRQDRKLYTHDSLTQGQEIEDINEVRYTVDSELPYDDLSTFKRYYIKKVGASSD